MFGVYCVRQLNLNIYRREPGINMKTLYCSQDSLGVKVTDKSSGQSKVWRDDGSLRNFCMHKIHDP